MRQLASSLSLLVIGCASSPGAPAAPPGPPADAPEVFSIADRYREGTISNVQPDVDRVSVVITAPPDAVWEALIQVYAETGIEIAGADPGTRVLNNPDFVVSRRLGGERLSRYLECGSGTLGRIADQIRIQMSILSHVESTSDGMSTLHTTIQAIGNNPEGTSNTRIPCSSTLQLELRIAKEVGDRVERVHDPG